MLNASWHLVDDDATLGQTGPEGGVIICDEEHPAGARITLERGGGLAPVSITCGVYGVMFHTRFFADEVEARNAYDLMKPGLASVAAGDASDASAGASAFVERFS